MKKSFVAAAVLIACSVCLCSRATAEQECQKTKCVEKHEVGVPVLDKVPHIHRLFKNIGTPSAQWNCADVENRCAKSTKCSPHDGAKHVAIKLDVVECKSAKSPCHAECKIGATADCCQKNAAVAHSHGCHKSHAVAKQADCACGAACKCAAAAKNETVADRKHATKALAAFKAAHKIRKEADNDRAKMFESFTKLREESARERAKLLEALVEAKAEIAHLHAQVELAQQKHELLQTVMKTMSENVQLKAQLELVSQRQQTQQTVARISAENAQLKSQLTKLEQQIAAKARGTRTAEVLPAPRHKQ